MKKVSDTWGLTPQWPPFQLYLPLGIVALHIGVGLTTPKEGINSYIIHYLGDTTVERVC